MGNPKFTVIIPTYNVAPYIESCLDSVLQQTFPDFEILVIDDGSTDRTVDLVKSFTDERISVLVNDSNQGVSRTRNQGIDQARGEYLVLLDSDDTIEPGRLAAVNQRVEQAKPDIIFDDLLYRPEGNPDTTKSAYSQRNISPEDAGNLVFNDFISKDLGILKGTFRKSFVNQHHIRFEEGFRIGEDFVFYAEMFLRGAEASFLPDAMYVYRQRPDSLISTEYDGYRADMVRTSKHLLKKYESELQRLPQTRRLLEMRLGNHSAALNEHLTKSSLKNGNLAGALSLIAKDPSIGIRLGKKGVNQLRSALSRVMR